METVGKARQYGIMSVETSVDQLYGDTWTDEEKKNEVERLKAEQGLIELEEPAVNRDTNLLQRGNKDAGEGHEPDLPDE